MEDVRTGEVQSPHRASTEEQSPQNATTGTDKTPMETDLNTKDSIDNEDTDIQETSKMDPDNPITQDSKDTDVRETSKMDSDLVIKYSINNVEDTDVQEISDNEETGAVSDVAEETPTVMRTTRAKIKKEFKCNECQQSFTAEASYNEHMLNHTELDGAYPCRTCKSSFSTKTGLLNHMRMHIANKTRTYKCAVCGNTFETNLDLKKHKSVHSGITFTCSLAKRCIDLTFNNHLEYWYHELSHYNYPKPKCVECGVYINKGYMKTHILTHFDVKSKCDICGGSYANLASHVKTHGQESQCVECGRVFREKGQLKQHMMSHTGVRKYQCLYCGKGFVTTQQRRNHTALHTGEKPYECDICGHRSRQRGDAKRHRETHSQEKKYQCDYCRKMFYHKESVLAHIRGHTRSRVYQCPHCDYTTPTNTGLRSHITYKHIKVKPFKCDLCNVAFKVRSQLGRHTASKAHRNNAYAATKTEAGND